jgi:hypothetical protein
MEWCKLGRQRSQMAMRSPRGLADWPVTRLGEPEPEPNFFRATVYRISPSTTRQRHCVFQVILAGDRILLQAIQRLSLLLLPYPNYSTLPSRSNSSLGPHVVSLLERTRPISSLHTSPLCHCESTLQLRHPRYIILALKDGISRLQPDC